MPIVFQTQKVPSKAVQEKEKEKKKLERKKQITAKKIEKKQRMVAAEAILFGSNLFEPIARREREIVVRFPERFTKNRTRISICGKFAFRQTNEFYFELFYFLIPLLEYEDDLVVSPDENIILLNHLTIEELEDTVIRLIRAEFANEKAELLKLLKEEDTKRQEENDRIDAEFEKELEEGENSDEQQFNGTNDSESSSPTTSVETPKFGTEKQENNEIRFEESKEKEVLATESPIQEIKKGISFIPTFKKVS